MRCVLLFSLLLASACACHVRPLLSAVLTSFGPGSIEERHHFLLVNSVLGASLPYLPCVQAQKARDVHKFKLHNFKGVSRLNPGAQLY